MRSTFAALTPAHDCTEPICELDEIGEENRFGNLDDALNRAREHLGLLPVAHPDFATPTVTRETATDKVPANHLHAVP